MSYVLLLLLLLLQVSKFTDIRELPIHTQRSINLANGKNVEIIHPRVQCRVQHSRHLVTSLHMQGASIMLCEV